MSNARNSRRPHFARPQPGPQTPDVITPTAPDAPAPPETPETPAKPPTEPAP